MWVMGGFKLGITKARAKLRAVAGTTDAIKLPSLRCKCQSSGWVSVKQCIAIQYESNSKKGVVRVKLIYLRGYSRTTSPKSRSYSRPARFLKPSRSEDERNL